MNFYTHLNIYLTIALIFSLTIGNLQQHFHRNSAATSVSQRITADQMRAYLSFIASDEMEGRATPSRGLDITAKYIATNLARWGVKPLGDNGTYFQQIALRRDCVDAKKSRAEINGETFNYGSDFIATADAITLNGPYVYVGHGWTIKSKNIDPYSQIDVKNKVVIGFAGDLPKGVNFSDLTGQEGEDWLSPVDNALKQGARAYIVVPNYQALGNWEKNQQRSIEKGKVSVERFKELALDKMPKALQPLLGPELPLVTPSIKMINVMFSKEKLNGNTILNRTVDEVNQPFELSREKQISINVVVRSQKVMTQNIVGLIEGSDPVLKNEYVAIGAHYDHVGGDITAPGDAIYNGADDDGSGTVALMALAETYGQQPIKPKRSILFVWHCGEEVGLWGSLYFTEFPVVPLNQIITQLNIDMIGRSRPADDQNPNNKQLTAPDEIYLIGSKMMSSELGELSESVNQGQYNLKFNYQYDDPNDPNNFFYRSDHYCYARKGIPIIFYFGGPHQDYHRVTDSIEKIDFIKMEKITRTIYTLSWELATRAARPKVDKGIPAEK